METVRLNGLAGVLAGLCVLTATTVFSDSDIVVADFEGLDYGSWVVEGSAFGPKPIAGRAHPRQMKVEGFEGDKLVNSYHKGDGAIGRLVSPEFKIDRSYINFLIGGGGYPDETCMNLLVEGKVVRTATGSNTKAGGSERLIPSSWDVSEFIGNKAVIEIVDSRKGSWGHITVDHIVQADRGVWQEIELKLLVEKAYLNIPVDNSVKPERVYVYDDNSDDVDYYFNLQLADSGDEDFWVFMNLDHYKGKHIRLKTRRAKSQGLDAFKFCYQSETPREAATFYKESKRPQYHFTSKRGWLNDSNGLVYYKGEYHLFYQHNPYGWKWGNMHWGHAVSTNLVHWTELDDAVYPDRLGNVHSGSAVVDWSNTAGLKRGNDDPIILFYTGAGDHAPVKVPRAQAISFSTDGGISFQKFEGNPVVDHIIGYNRDPKVIWHAESEAWIMALYLEGHDYCLLASEDLLQWERICALSLDGVKECPDLFSLKLDDDENNTKWVFWGGDSTYLVGSFDGKTFTPETVPQKCFDVETAFGGQTFSDIPKADGRCIQMVWMRTKGAPLFEGMPFNQQMAFPVELTLKTIDSVPKIHVWPVQEIRDLYTRKHSFPQQLLSPGSSDPLSELNGDQLDIYVEFELDDNIAEFGFKIRGKEFVYNTSTKQIQAGGKTVGLKPVDGRINMRILIDVMSVELFAGDGLVYMPMYCLGSEEAGSVEIFSRGGSVGVKELTVHELKSIWR